MAITIDYSDPAEFVISIPKADMTLVQTTPYEIRELDIEDFRDWLADVQDDTEGIAFPTAFQNTAPLTISGVVIARVLEILDPYTVEFEDGTYGVNVVGGNSNIADVLVRNQVSLYTANSAGLVNVGSGVTSTDIEDIADAVWDEDHSDHKTAGTTGDSLRRTRFNAS